MALLLRTLQLPLKTLLKKTFLYSLGFNLKATLYPLSSQRRALNTNSRKAKAIPPGRYIYFYTGVYEPVQ